MKVIKKINNNVAVCVDQKGKEFVAFGKGIGFPNMPYELVDLSSIHMTFYRLNQQYYMLLQELPEDVFDISVQVVKRAQQILPKSLNPNIVFSIADHINFALLRLQKFKELKMIFSYDIEQLYPLESDLGRFAVKLVETTKGIQMPYSEVGNIALHFINAQEEIIPTKEEQKAEIILNKVVVMIEEQFDIIIKQESFMYHRFMMHLRYFLKRVMDNQQFVDHYTDVIGSIKKDKPQVYLCAHKVAGYIDQELEKSCSDDEILYLMIHINRMVSK